MHLDSEQLQRLLHGESLPGGSAGPRDHLTECAECRDRLEVARREEAEVFGLLARLDHPAGAPDIRAVLDSARRPPRLALRLAAGFLLALLGAGAAWAIPGSPLPGWVRTGRAWITDRSRVAPAPGPDAPTTGLAIPAGDRFVVEFAATQDSGEVEVRLVDGEQLVARAMGTGVSFITGPGRLQIENAGVRTGYQLEVPRATRSVEVRVAGRRILMKDGERSEPALPANGALLLSLGPPLP